MMKFNLAIITQDDPFYVRSFFDEFFRTYRDVSEIRAIIIQKPMGKSKTGTLIKQMFDFYGPIDFVRVGSRYVVSRVLNNLATAFNKEQWLDLEGLCLAHRIKVLHQDDLHDAPFLDWLRCLNLDLIVSVAAPSIFREKLIKLPRLGCINIHHAPLPRYRGMMPNFWQLYHGEKTVGITIHKINPKIDEGEIILQRQVPVNPGESLDALIRRTKRLGAHCMVEAIKMMRNGDVRYFENRPEEGSYFSFPKKEDVQRFREMGYKLL